MSLFLVNRYLGEEGDGGSSQKSRSQALLEKLQRKAREKQNQSSTVEGQSFTVEQIKQNNAQKKRKPNKSSSQDHALAKKSRLDEDSSPDFDSDHSRDCVEEGTKGKGAKKKKRSLSAATSADVDVSSREGSEDTGQKAVEVGGDATSGSTGETLAPTGFKVLGGFENKPVQKVHRVLPQWLAQPDMIHRDIKSNLVPLADVPEISARLIRKLISNGIQHLFPVQKEVIPAILESAQQGLLIGRGGYKPRDICVSAPTGSGKTLAFVIPVVQVLSERVVCEVRALVVLPTKELCQQVFKVFTTYAEGTSLKVVMVAGQKSFSAEQASLSELRGDVRRSLADIVVATPGRLVDHINKNPGFCLEHLRFLIIDEADRMIDSMHQLWLSQMVKAVFKSGSEPNVMPIFRRAEPTHVTAASLSPPQMPLQKLLFSATLTQNPEKLQQLGLHQPRLFSSVSGSTATTPAPSQDRFDFPEGLTEYYVPCTLNKKPLLVLHFILHMKLSPILCFTNSRETAHRLLLLVQLFGGIQAAEFSSRLSPGERKKTLKEFEQGKIQLLISTDAAARGIDVVGVKSVVNYDAPQYIRTYIHRIGRTARAGKAGLAFTFLLGVQEKRFVQMVKDAGSPGIEKQIIGQKNLKSLEARFEQTLQQLANVIKDEKASTISQVMKQHGLKEVVNNLRRC